MVTGRTKIAIVAGEPSGDSLGSGLITALKSAVPGACFLGVGGPKMREAGCTTLYDMVHLELMGFDGLFGKLGGILKIRRALYRKFMADPPDLFIGIDVPDFNLSLEGKLRKHGIKTLHYVSPTVWAWRGYRIHKIRRAVDHMLTLFPFEADYYRSQQVPATCVGHPIADEIDEPDARQARHQLGIGAGHRVIALLPGSRRSEVMKLGPVIVDAVKRLHREDPGIRFVLPFANPRVEREFYRVARGIDELPVTTYAARSRQVLEACDIAILASGTAALEAALLRKPHVVIYKLSPLTYWLVRRLRHVDHYSMPNQLLPEPVIPELIQDRANGTNIVHAVNGFLRHPERLRQLQEQFARVHTQLRRNANLQASRAVVKLLEGGE
ncbi:MAG: lipid-A-disaccharide synthase [Gammaproteobacteria bacterium]|nr:lipid-A-disaccharide synthase [Gammaproteobacteria bacterium]